MKQVVTEGPPGQGGQMVLSLQGIAREARKRLRELVFETGKQVIEKMLEEDVEAVCGPRYRHQEGREGYRWGSSCSEVVLGGRKVGIKRPRVRKGLDGPEVELPMVADWQQEDPLNERVMEQVVCGVSTRKYQRSLEPLPEGWGEERATSRSTVSRRFVARTLVDLKGWMDRPLGDMDLVVMFVDGIRFGSNCLVVAMGGDSSGVKHILGLWHGDTENTEVAKSLVANLVERGVDARRSMFWVIDGSKALRRAIREVFEEAALVQRCRIHKRRNILGHLPRHMHAEVSRLLREAWNCGDVEKALRRLKALAAQLEYRYPQAAESVREGMEETLTVLALGLPPSLARSLCSTNAIESLVSSIRFVTRNVKRWRGGQMVLRWSLTAVQEARKRFRRIMGYRELPALVRALRAHDRKLGTHGGADAAA